MEHNYYLAHHGVKGQKWGIRKEKKAMRNLIKRHGYNPQEVHNMNKESMLALSKRLEKERKFKKKHPRDKVINYLEKNGVKNVNHFYEDQLIDKYKKVRTRKAVARALGAAVGVGVGLSLAKYGSMRGGGGRITIL